MIDYKRLIGFLSFFIPSDFCSHSRPLPCSLVPAIGVVVRHWGRDDDSNIHIGEEGCKKREHLFFRFHKSLTARWLSLFICTLLFSSSCLKSSLLSARYSMRSREVSSSSTHEHDCPLLCSAVALLVSSHLSSVPDKCSDRFPGPRRCSVLLSCSVLFCSVPCRFFQQYNTSDRFVLRRFRCQLNLDYDILLSIGLGLRFSTKRNSPSPMGTFFISDGVGLRRPTNFITHARHGHARTNTSISGK